MTRGQQVKQIWESHNRMSVRIDFDALKSTVTFWKLHPLTDWQPLDESLAIELFEDLVRCAREHEK